MIATSLNHSVQFSQEAEQTVRLFLSKKVPLPSPRDFLKMLANRRQSRPVEDHALVTAGWVAAGGNLGEMVEVAKRARSYAAQHPDDVEAREVGEVLAWYKSEVVQKREENGFGRVAEAAERRAAELKAAVKSRRRF